MRFKNAVATGALAIFAIAFTGCRTTFSPPSASSLPASELRAMQTRTYDLMDQTSALKVVLDVLQDDGYIVDYGNSELGILHGTKIGDLGGERSFSTPNFSTTPGTGVQTGPARYEATVNVSYFGIHTKIRISLQRFIPEETAVFAPATSLLSPRSTLIVDAKTYQEFFAKLDRGMFLQKQGL